MNVKKEIAAPAVSLKLINQLPVIYYRYLPGDQEPVILISRGCQAITGYAPESFLGEPKLSLSDLVYEEDRADVRSTRQIIPGITYDFAGTYRIKRADGSLKWVKEVATGVYTRKKALKYIEGCITDMDAEKKGNQAINSLVAYQNSVNTAAIVSITDPQGMIVFANDLFCKISQFTRDELMGKSHRLINSRYHKKSFFTALWKTISAGRIWHGEIRNKAKDGTCYWVDTTISPIFDNDGAIIQYLSIRSLITGRKNLEHEREQLISELTHKYNELMQFNYIVSHNLRAPIANMISLTRLLTEEGDDCRPEIRTLIDYLSRSVLSVDEVIHDLSHILAARNPIHQKMESINLIDIIESVENSLENQIIASGAKIMMEIGQSADHFRSIKSYIQSILYNLVSNAIKYGSEQTVPVIQIRAAINHGWLALSVSDNGIGMDLAKIGHQLFGLYKKFNFDKEGRGLGLHMTQTQVVSLGGRIEVKSQPGSGSTFLVSLPV